MEALGKHRAVLGIIHPFLADGVADAERRTSEHLTAQCLRVKHGADISVCQEVDDVVFAGLEIDFDFGEAGDIGTCLAVVRIFVASRCDEALPGQRR